GATLSCLRGLNPVGALLTIRAGLILPLLTSMAARRLASVRLAHIACLLVICGMMNCALGILQSSLTPDLSLNRYVAAESPISAVETAVRATGTFSYITGLGVMSSVGVWGGMVFLAFAEKRLPQLLAICGIVAGIGCGLSSVSRGPILLDGLVLLAWGCLSGSGFNALSKSAVIWVPMVLLMCCVGFFPRFNQLGHAVIERHQTGEDTFLQRAFGQLHEGGEAAAAFPFGGGLGTEQVGGNY